MSVGYLRLQTQPMPLRDFSKFFLLWAKVTPKTQQQYRQAVNLFLRWCNDNNVKSGTNADLDWTLCEYIHEQYEQHGGAGRALVAKTLSGLQLLVPPLRGQLRWSAQCLAGWSKLHPAQKHPPLTWNLTVAIATQLAVWGRFNMAVGTLLSFCALLRIGELTSLTIEDVLDAGADDSRVDGTDTSGLRLQRTKTGENKFAEIHNDSVRDLLRILMQGRRPDAKLFDFSADTYRKWFKRAVVALGLDDRYVPHSLRHGGATALYMAGVPLETILVRGRWASTKSARHYIQSGRAMLLAQKVPAWVRNLGRLVSTQLHNVFMTLHRRCRVRFSARAQSILSGMRARLRQQQQAISEPQRHSSRHDFMVKPDYAALDSGQPHVPLR